MLSPNTNSRPSGTLPPESWQRIEELYLAALEQAPEARQAWLARVCSQDDALRREVESLLAADGRAGDFLEHRASEHFSARLPKLSPAFDPGHQLGRYRLVREIGHGGMGTVYLAERTDGEFHQRVAIKLVRQGFESDFLLRRFRHEREILARLEHPNIARLLDGGTSPEGVPYLVMEFVEGQPIDEYCRQRQLPLPARLELFRTVCAAVQYAHQTLVIHRDLKPGNILVTADGTPKLLDFGISKLLDPENARAESTLTRQLPMTPEYACPEQTDGSPITTASDVYSLGVILYQLLTGQRPYEFKNRSAREVAEVIRHHEPANPSDAVRHARASECATHSPDKLRRALIGDLDNIVRKALRKEPERRYASVEQLAADLHRHLDGLPVIARKDTFSYRSAKFIRRHKTGVTALALVLMALFVGLMATTWQARVAWAQRLEAEAARVQADRQRLRAEAALANAETERQRAVAAQSHAETQEARAKSAQVRAEAEQARAQRHFNDVRQLANAMLFEFYAEIKNLPGSLRARTLLIERGFEYLDRLAREAGEDPKLQRELAKAYDRVGNLQANSSAGEVGDPQVALRSYERALKIRQSLARQFPGEWRRRYDLALSYRRLGEVLALTQRRDEARTHYQQALALLAPIAVAHPGEWAVQQARLYLHQRLGLLLVNAGEQAAALPHIEQAQALLGSLPPRFKGVKTKEKRQAAKPAAAVTQDESAVAPESSDADESAGYANGVLLRARGDLDGALAQFQQELVRLETEAAAKPNDAGMQGRLGSVQMRVGDVLLQLRRHAEAVGHYRAAIAIYANLFARDQANARLSRNLSGSHRKLATTLKSLEAEAEALSHYQQAAELDETLAARQPGYAPALNLAANHQDAARLWETAGDVAAAEHHYRRALIWRTTQAAREPEDATLRLKLSEAHIGLADLVRRQGKTAEAVEQYRQALALAESVEQQTLAQVAARQVRSVCHYRLGECLVKLNDMAGAFDHFQRTAAIREALAAQPDANVTQRLEPMFAYAHLSELHTKLATSAATPQAERIKHWQAARAWHARSLAIVLELRARGLLPAKHLAKPDELARAIAECDTALTELSSAVTAPPHP